MKYFLILSFLMGTYAFAAEPDLSDGCGLGWNVTDKRTFSATTTRGTTNAVVPPTFGMSSGTLGCDTHGLVKLEKRIIHFAENNFENLIAESAIGSGEHLEIYASHLGCQNTVEFKKAMQGNIESLIQYSHSGLAFINGTKIVLNNNPHLNCSL